MKKLYMKLYLQKKFDQHASMYIVVLDNFYLTPHTAARTKESETRTCEMSTNIIMEQLLGK